MNETLNERGFALVEFVDRYGVACSLQKSSLATEDCIWLGPNDANPRVLTQDGWSPVDVPPGTLFSTRMHLTRDQARALLPYLQRFADTGEPLE